MFSTVCVEKQAVKSGDIAEKTDSDGQPLPAPKTEKTVERQSMADKKAKVGSGSKLIIM